MGAGLLRVVMCQLVVFNWDVAFVSRLAPIFGFGLMAYGLRWGWDSDMTEVAVNAAES